MKLFLKCMLIKIDHKRSQNDHKEKLVRFVKNKWMIFFIWICTSEYRIAKGFFMPQRKDPQICKQYAVITVSATLSPISEEAYSPQTQSTEYIFIWRQQQSLRAALECHFIPLLQGCYKSEHALFSRHEICLIWFYT